MQLPESVQPGLVTRITRLLGDHDTGEGETSDPAQKLGVSQPSERPRGADPKIWNQLPSLGRMELIDARGRRFDSCHVAGPQ